MKRPLFFDTNVYINHAYQAGLHKTWLCAVVVQEMMAGARSNVRAWENTMRKYNRENRLVTPDAEDWLLVGKALHAMLREERAGNYLVHAALTSEGQRRIVRDVLIARSVKSVNGLLVTENGGDFDLIKRFCNVKTLDPEDFF